jgi:hypothetical protein
MDQPDVVTVRGLRKSEGTGQWWIASTWIWPPARSWA